MLEQFQQFEVQNPHTIQGGGRAHGDSDGIPPDGQIRTNWGVYPSGGLFDEDQETPVKNSGTDGGL